MEVTLAISEGLDIFCVPRLGNWSRICCWYWNREAQDRPGILTPRASVLIFHPIRQSNLALARANLFPQNTSIKPGIHGAVQSSHVGALVKWPRNDELRIMKATRMASKIFNKHI